MFFKLTRLSFISLIFFLFAGNSLASTGIVALDDYIINEFGGQPEPFNTLLQQMSERQIKEISNRILGNLHAVKQAELLERARLEAVLQPLTLQSFYQQCTSPRIANQLDLSSGNAFLLNWRRLNIEFRDLEKNISELLSRRGNVQNIGVRQDELYPLYSWLKRRHRDMRLICDAIVEGANSVRLAQVFHLVFTRLPALENRISLLRTDLVLLLVSLTNKERNEILALPIYEAVEIIKADLNEVMEYKHLARKPSSKININGRIYDIFEPSHQRQYIGDVASPSHTREAFCEALRYFNAFQYIGNPPNFVSNVLSPFSRSNINELVEIRSPYRLPNKAIEVFSRVFPDAVVGAIYDGIRSLLFLDNVSESGLRQYQQILSNLRMNCSSQD